MKKLLLTLGCLAVMLGGTAKTYTPATAVPDDYIDVTPGYYLFNSQENANFINAMVKTDHTFGAQNLGNSNAITNNLNSYFTTTGLKNGYFLPGGYYYNNAGKMSELKEGISLFDFGGKIGKVLIINGSNSKLNEAIASKFNMNSAPEIPKMLCTLASGNNSLFFWILDHLTMAETKNVKGVRIRLEVNAYNNDMETQNAALSLIQLQSEINNAYGATEKIYFTDFADDNGQWDPSHWMVYEEELSNVLQIGQYLRMVLNENQEALSEGALLFRNIEIYLIPDSSATSMTNATVYKTWNEYSLDGANPQPIEPTPGVDPDPNPGTDPEPEGPVTKEKVFPTAEAIPSNFIDVTPSYYKFYQGNTNLDEMLRDDIKSPAQSNFGNSDEISSNIGTGKNWFTEAGLAKGNLIYRSGGYHTDVTPCPLLKGFSLFDFGGDLGEVLVLNGRNSKLNEAIQEAFGLDHAYNIPKMESNFNNMQLMWILDRTKMNNNTVKDTKDRVRVRIEYNVYNNDMTVETPALKKDGFFLQNQSNGNTRSPILNEGANIDEFTYRIGDNNTVAGEEYDSKSTEEWNPYRWMVLDFEATYTRTASYLRTFIDAANYEDYNNGAWLIRSIEVYVCPQNYSSDMALNTTVYKSWNDYTGKINVAEPTFDQYKETPSEKSIEEETSPGEEITDANFEGFHNDTEHENIWTENDTEVTTNYYYSTTSGKNSTLAEDAVKINGNSVTISAPDDMGEELHLGVVRIKTGLKIEEGSTYNFSCTASSSERTRAANAPEILVKLTSDGSNKVDGLANKTSDGSVHYISNAELSPGNLVLEVHFGGNAGKDITLSNITFALNEKGETPGGDPETPGDDQGDFEVGEYSGEPTVNRALLFSEEGTVKCGAMPELNNLSSYSIQFWMKPIDWKEGAVLMHRGDSFSVELGANNTIVFKNDSNSVTARGFVPGDWNQVTLIVNNGTANVLVNSVENTSGTLGTLEDTKRGFILGGGYNGYLDEVRIWSAALNDMMKRFDYFTNNTLNKWNPMWENLVAYYKMDQEASPILVDYKVIETRKADGTNNHGVYSGDGVKKVLAENDYMPYLVNAAYTENERFYDRLIPQDAYLLSNEIIVLGADCVAEDGSVKTRLANNHASVYGNVNYAASVGNRTGVAQFDGSSSSYLKAPAATTHKYRETSSSDYLNEDHSTYTYMTRLYIDSWQPGACLFRKENDAKTAGIAIMLGETPNTITIRTNGKTNISKAIENFNLGAWNHITVVVNESSRSAATKYNLYVGATGTNFDSSLCSIENVALNGAADCPVYIGEGLKGYMDEIYFTNQILGIGMIQAYANRVIVPTVEQGRNVKEMNAAGFLYNFDNSENLGYSTYSQDYIADYIRSLYKGYSPAKITLAVRGHNGNTNADDFTQIWQSDAKINKFADDLINAAESYDGVEFDLEWCQNATAWENLSKLSDAVEERLPEDKTFRISIHNAYYNFPKGKINNDKLTGFTVQQYGPNATYYPYSTFEKACQDLQNYGYPKDKLMTSFSTTMQGGGDIRGGAYASYVLNDNDVDTYNGLSFMGPMQVFKRAKYTRENKFQGIFYWSMGSDLWLGSKDMGSGGVANYEGMPEYNGAKYCSYGLNANIDKVVLSAKISHPDTEIVPGEEYEIPDLDDNFAEGDGNGGSGSGSGSGWTTSGVDSIDSVDYVDVYTLDGILLKKDLKSSEISNSLDKGIYIINGKKIQVK